MTKYIQGPAFVLGLLLSAGVAAEALVTPQAAIEQRQQGFKTIQKNFKLMNAMLRGEQTFDQGKMAESANNIASSAQTVLHGFQVAGTDQGDTKAKPVIWQRWDDFESRMLKFQQDTQLLASVAQQGDRGELRQAFAAAGKNCKACHQTYRFR